MNNFENKFLSISHDDSLSDREKTYKQAERLIDIEKICKDSVVVDIGSNFGEVIRALTSTNCKIYGFEPHPLFYEMLVSEYSDNKNIILSNSAVWVNKEKRKFYFKKSPTALNGGATLMSDKLNINGRYKLEVNCIDIAEFINKIGFVDVLKIDVEGAEYELLYRLYQSGAYKNVRSIYFEDHSRKMVTNRFFALRQEVIAKYEEVEKELYWW